VGKKKSEVVVVPENIEAAIHVIRGQRVMLDADRLSGRSMKKARATFVARA
jgi:hypothetical protein